MISMNNRVILYMCVGLLTGSLILLISFIGIKLSSSQITALSFFIGIIGIIIENMMKH